MRPEIGDAEIGYRFFNNQFIPSTPAQQTIRNIQFEWLQVCAVKFASFINHPLVLLNTCSVGSLSVSELLATITAEYSSPGTSFFVVYGETEIGPEVSSDAFVEFIIVTTNVTFSCLSSNSHVTTR